ncbi:hypothetical protein HMI55_005365 [Coelomomyces lativittatus]|nr:hypothetical protein HMI55_005365 [Coelomomyces lativittatus]
MLNNLHPTSSSSSTLPLDKEKMDVDVDLERDELNMDTHHSDVMKTPTFASAATTSTSSTTPVDEPLVPLSNQPLHSIDDVTVDRATCVSHLTLLFPYRLLYQQRDPLLLRSLAWFESKDIYLRSRAIRILSQTIEVQPSIMHRPHKP